MVITSMALEILRQNITPSWQCVLYSSTCQLKSLEDPGACTNFYFKGSTLQFWFLCFLGFQGSEPYPFRHICTVQIAIRILDVDHFKCTDKSFTIFFYVLGFQGSEPYPIRRMHCAIRKLNMKLFGSREFANNNFKGRSCELFVSFHNFTIVCLNTLQLCVFTIDRRAVCQITPWQNSRSDSMR